VSKPKAGGGGHGGGGVWLMSYADMVTLLLAFFIVMYTMSQIDINKLKALVGSLNSSFDPKPKGPKFDSISSKTRANGESTLVPGGSATIAKVAYSNGVKATKGPGKTAKPSAAEKSLEEVVQHVQEAVKAAGLERQVHTRLDARGAAISFTETADGLANVVPFASGSAELTEGFRHFLDRLAPLLRGLSNKIEVQGHTDRRPIHTVAFPSNWELSGARAGSVVRYWVSAHGLEPRLFVCTGFADTAPVSTDDTPDGWAHNRRIEIIITRNPVDVYDSLTRDQATAEGQKPGGDLTQPLGPSLVDVNVGKPPLPQIAHPGGDAIPDAAPASDTAPAPATPPSQ
jgi:chemotaxis protein MotB